MATGSVLLPVLACVQPATNFPTVDFTTTELLPYLEFDASTDETCYWYFRLPTNYAGTPVLKIQWSNSTTSTGNVVWGCQVQAITPNADADDMTGARTFATAQTVTDAGVGTRQPQEASISITNTDSAAANDFYAVKLYRDADNGSDTMAEDCFVYAVTFEYSDT